MNTEQNYTDMCEMERGCKRGCVAVVIVVIVAAICVLFCGCTSQKDIGTRYNIVFRDSAKIEKLTDSVRVLNIKINEQTQVIIVQNERLKTFENAKINEKITDFDKEGNISKIQERTIDYSKSTDSEKIFFWQYLYEKTSEERDSIQKVLTENELIWQNKEIDYQQKIKQKISAKSFWWLWLIIGAAGYAVGEFFVKKYFGKFLGILKGLLGR